jgi:tetratricopeptide (TPR) repeat protein
LRRVAPWLVPALLFLALHLRALDYGFVWTDHGEIEAGSILRPAGRLHEAFAQPLQHVDDFRTRHLQQPYYRPLQVVTASWLAHTFGREPRSFRAPSLALGAATVSLFALLVACLTGSAGAALLAGCVLAAHPVGLETWVWISGLSAALAAFFVVASLLLGVRALLARSSPARAALATGSLAALALGLLSKENAAVTPALLLAAAAGLAFESRRTGGPAAARSRRFAAGAAALTAGQLLLVLGLFLGVRPAVLGSALSAVPPVGGRSTWQLATALAHWPEALGWLFLPLRSNTSDAVRLVHGLLDPSALAGAALLVGSIAAATALALCGRGIAATALAWLWIGFLPTSGLVPLLHLGAERNVFFALFGAALLWTRLGAPLRRAGAPRAAVAGLAVLLVLGLAQRSWARTPDWRSTLTLFGRDVARDPRHREGRFDLALRLLQQGRAEEAVAHADTLLGQRSEAGRWSSYLRWGQDLELHCLAHEVVGRDAAVLRLWDAGVAGPPSQAWKTPGYHECVARALERSARFEEALAIWLQVREAADPASRPPFDLAIARCYAQLDRRGLARQWLARVPRGAGHDAEIARVARLIRRAAPAPP